MKKIILDCRRKLNSGIGRVTQWIVDNIVGNLSDIVEVNFLATEETILQYNLPLQDSIIVDFNAFSIQDLEEIPKILKDNNCDLYINPQFNCSPYLQTPFISIIHDLWYIQNPTWLPTAKEIGFRFNFKVLSQFENVNLWATESLFTNLLTPYGNEVYNNILKTKSIIAEYSFTQISIVAKFAHHIVFVNPHDKENFKKIFKRNRNLHFILNGIKKFDSSFGKESLEHFLCLAKLEPRKNILNLLEGYKKYQNNTKNPYKLLIVGDIGYEEYSIKVRNIISEMVKEGIQVQFLPDQNDKQIQNLFNRSVALICPSYAESYGLPNIEALRCGIPVISTEVGMLKNTRLGDYCRKIDFSSASIYEAMLDLHKDSKKYNLLSEDSKVEIDNMIDDSTITEQWISVIKQAMQKI